MPACQFSHCFFAEKGMIFVYFYVHMVEYGLLFKTSNDVILAFESAISSDMKYRISIFASCSEFALVCSFMLICGIMLKSAAFIAIHDF